MEERSLTVNSSFTSASPLEGRHGAARLDSHSTCVRPVQRPSPSSWKESSVAELKTWGQRVAEDPRYKEVKALVAQDKFDEAQALETQIALDVIGPRDPR
jgi:hypothetical protein